MESFSIVLCGLSASAVFPDELPVQEWREIDPGAMCVKAVPRRPAPRLTGAIPVTYDLLAIRMDGTLGLHIAIG